MLQLVPRAGVLPGGVFLHIRRGAGVHHGLGAGHELLNVDARHGYGQQTHRREDAVAAADVVGHHEALVALRCGQRLQGALLAVGGGVDAPRGSLGAVLFLQQPAEKAESHRRLRGGAGLGDDVHGEILPLQQFLHLRQLVVVQPVAHEVDIGRVFLFQIIIRRAEALDDAPCPQIRAADADDHQRLRIALDLFGRRLNAPELLAVILLWQMYPAGEVTAGAGAAQQLLVRQTQTGRQRRFIGQGNELPHIGKIHTDHVKSLLFCPFPYLTSQVKKTQEKSVISANII